MTAQLSNDELTPFHLHSCHSKQAWIKGMTRPFPCDCGLDEALNDLINRKVVEARKDENWLLMEQTHKVADENGGSLRKTKVSLEAIVYWSRDRIKELSAQLGEES